MTDETKPPTRPAPQGHEDEVDLLDLLVVLWKWKWLILFMPVMAAAVAFFVVKQMTPIYEAKTTLFVVSETGPKQVLSLVPEGLPAGLLGGLFGPTQSDYLIALLSSRTAAWRVIKRLKLDKNDAFVKKGEKPITKAKLISLFQEAVEVEKDRKTNAVTVTASNSDPDLSAKMANTLVKEAEKMVVTKGDAHIQFLEDRVKEAKKRLNKAQKSLKAFQERNRVVELSTQAQKQIEAIASLRQKEVEAAVQLADLKEKLKKAGNLELLSQLQLEKDGIEKSLAEIRRRIQEEEGKLSAVPEKSMELANITLENKIAAALYESLVKELSIAKLEREKEDVVFQVVDPATPPEKPVKPKKLITLVLSFVTASFLAIFLAFFLEFVQNARSRLKEKLKGPQEKGRA